MDKFWKKKKKKIKDIVILKILNRKISIFFFFLYLKKKIESEDKHSRNIFSKDISGEENRKWKMIPHPCQLPFSTSFKYFTYGAIYRPSIANFAAKAP